MLAAGAAGAALLLTGALSTAFTSAKAPASASARRDAGDAVRRLVPRVAQARPVAAPAAPPPGNWQIQIGAFSSADVAEAQLRAAATLVPELGSLAELPQSAGPVVRARFGGISDEGRARRLCAQVVDSGGGCFVVRRGG